MNQSSCEKIEIETIQGGVHPLAHPQKTAGVSRAKRNR